MAEKFDGTGILAIWHDCAGGEEATFEHWYQSEHLIERVSVPGFRFGRRYEGSDGFRQYFTYYVTDTPSVLTSEAYLSRVDDPTPLTRAVMDGIFLRACRTVCRRTARRGGIDGAIVVTGVSRDAAAADNWTAALDSIVAHDEIASAEVWSEVEGASDTGSREQQMRGGDDTIAACLFVTVLRQDNVQAASDLMAANGVANGDIGHYRLLCELRSENLGRQ